MCVRPQHGSAWHKSTCYRTGGGVACIGHHVCKRGRAQRFELPGAFVRTSGAQVGGPSAEMLVTVSQSLHLSCSCTAQVKTLTDVNIQAELCLSKRTGGAMSHLLHVFADGSTQTAGAGVKIQKGALALFETILQSCGGCRHLNVQGQSRDVLLHRATISNCFRSTWRTPITLQPMVKVQCYS